MRELLAYSDQAIRELTSAHVLVVATPMHNYGMPAALKAWVDQIVRINETFSFDLSRGDFPLEPILSQKRLVTLTSAGEFGFAPGGIRAEMDHLHPHLTTLERYLGVSNSWHIGIEYQEFGNERFETSKQAATDRVSTVVAAVRADLHKGL